jgi:hypothetical protein
MHSCCRQSSACCACSLLNSKLIQCLECLAQESGWQCACARLFRQFPRLCLTRWVAANIAISHYGEQRIDLPLTSVSYHGIATGLSAIGRSGRVGTPQPARRQRTCCGTRTVAGRSVSLRHNRREASQTGSLVGSPCRANSPSSPRQRRSPLVSLRIQHGLPRRAQREFQ